MDGLLGSMRWRQVLVYIDDVVVFSLTLEQHVKSLDTLLSTAKRVGLRFSPAKCQFAMTEITLLSQHVSTAGISICEDHATAVRKLAALTLQQLYQLLGLFNYYCAFILNYATLTSPLTSLLKGYQYPKPSLWHSTNSSPTHFGFQKTFARLSSLQPRTHSTPS
ncbi:hypothetical protein NDA13_005693 [Ustilago tritici]|nr:hypothetical protein NDA13_005693 [Ustilago tritici]